MNEAANRILARLDIGLRLAGPSRAELERDYNRWLPHYYPKAVSKPMAYYHREFWEWLLTKPRTEVQS